MSTSTMTVVVSQGATRGVTPEEAKGLSHHRKDGKGFFNPWDSFKDLFGWKFGLEIAKMKMPEVKAGSVSVQNARFLAARHESANGLRATWLGHACYHVEFPNGFRVLFDPVFEDRCSPLSFMGPKRHTPPPCAIKDIPIIDAVVISHSHYDHLSHPTILSLKKSHPEAHFFVPLGIKKWFHDLNITRVTELDWWEDRDMHLTSGDKKVVADAGSTSPADISATISCLPAQHTSARSAFDRNETLWASWSVSSGGKSVWFGGDTGYRTVPQLPSDVDDYGPEQAHLPCCPAFSQIGNSRGPFDLGLVPIGAYDPRWIMSPVHANPYDSVNIFVDTKCRRAMGIHWGTWLLTTEDPLQPPRLLREALRKKGIPETGVFDVCDIGESREF